MIYDYYQWLFICILRIKYFHKDADITTDKVAIKTLDHRTFHEENKIYFNWIKKRILKFSRSLKNNICPRLSINRVDFLFLIRSTEAQLSKIISNSESPLKTRKCAMKLTRNGFLIKFLGGKPVKNVQFNPQTTEILPKELKVLLVSDGVSQWS